jgi:hypothetical protein
MNDWFARVGQPLSSAEQVAIGELIACAAPGSPMVIDALGSWQAAGRLMRLTAHDSAWWDDEEEEREALWVRAAQQRSEDEVLRQVRDLTRGLEIEMRRAAMAAGAMNAMLADEATAMALLAAHQRALAQLADADPGHRFIRKYALFAMGRWPLGYHAARFAIL